MAAENPLPSPTTIEAGVLFELIEERAALTPGSTMVLDERGRELSFGEYRRRVLGLAAGLLDLGVEPGGTVSWQLPTCFEALVLVGALSRLGVVQVLLLPAYRETELAHIAGETEPSTLIVSGRGDRFDHLGLARRMEDRLPGLRAVAIEDVATDSGSPLPVYVPPGPRDPRFLIYTSGTTGAPKGVRHSEQSVIAGSRAQYLAIGLEPADRQTLNFPIAHIGGVMMLASTLAVGCSTVIVDRFEPDRHVPLFRSLGVTLPGAGPPFFRLYLKAQREQPGSSILPAARTFPGGGGPKTPTMHEELKDEIGAGIFTAYGMSECPMVTTMRLDSPDEKMALTDGVPAGKAKLRLVDEREREVAVGEEGEIRVKAPQLFLGYVDPALDASAFDSEGYYRTGDLGLIDADGYLRLTGRLKDVIIRKGENISAKEIEDLLESLAAVAEVAVIGTPDEERGEMACAVVVPADAESPVDLAAITRHLEVQGLARHKLPECLVIVDELPKNVMGKVQKAKLRELVSADGENESEGGQKCP